VTSIGDATHCSIDDDSLSSKRVSVSNFAGAQLTNPIPLMRSVAGGVYSPGDTATEPIDSLLPRLPGEDYTTTSLPEIASWISIYEELAAVLRRIDSRPMGSELDGGRNRFELEWVEERLACWRSRHAELAGLVIDRPAHCLVYMGQKLKLTGREVDLLDFMLKHPGRTFTAKQLSARAWQNSWLSDGQVRTYIARLRHRLNEVGLDGAIRVERNRGYAVAAPAAGGMAS
jgi:hypothetical protein